MSIFYKTLNIIEITKMISIYLYLSNPKLQHQVRCASLLPKAKNEEEKIDVSCSEQFKRTTKTLNVCVPSSETKKQNGRRQSWCVLLWTFQNLTQERVCASLCPISKEAEEKADVFVYSERSKLHPKKHMCIPLSSIKTGWRVSRCVCSERSKTQCRQVHVSLCLRSKRKHIQSMCLL